jgi:uncharacterized Tic20 family protein
VNKREKGLKDVLPDKGPTQFERNCAMLAHLTALLTLLVGLSTGGLGAAVALLVPLGMYLYFRNRSAYVAYHALQATAFQAFGAIAAVVAAVLVGTVIAGTWLVTGLLSLVLIGLVLVPIALVLTVAAVLGTLALPFVLVAYALRGGYLTYQGLPFEYRWIGDLVARTMEARMAPSSSTPQAPPLPD